MNDNQDILYRLALQPGTTKTQGGKTYVLNENHRWTLPKEKDSPGQGNLFDSPREKNSDDSFWSYDFRIELGSSSDPHKHFHYQKKARDKALEEAKEQVRGLTGEIGKTARDKVVAAQIEMIFDDIDNLAAGRVPPGYNPKQFMEFELFNGLKIELTGDPADWSNSTADLASLDGLPPHVIASFKERRRRRERGIVRRMAVAANNLKTLIDPSEKPDLYHDSAIGGLDKIKFNPKDNVLTDGANGFFSAHAKRIGIIVANCYDGMFSPGKSKAPGYEELERFFTNITPEGIIIHELAHAINCDNLVKASPLEDGRTGPTEFWADWEKTFYSRPFQKNLKNMIGDESVEKFTERLEIAFPDIQKEWDDGAYRVNDDFVEFWLEQIELDAEGVSEYAGTCPAELVAEMFASPKPMNKFPKNLQTYYKLVGGPDFKLSNHKRSAGDAT